MEDLTIFAFIVIGFFAQMINGSLGMSYGTLSVAFLLTMGIPPIPASSSVHISKALTGGVSGVSHWRLGNVDKQLFITLAISGIAGGIVGAVLLSELPEHIAKPLIAVYLLFTGLNILRQTFRKQITEERKVSVLSLGAVGGLVDAVGGGGWGPVVTSTLLANGHNPHKSIGSVSFAEAFVASAITVTFFLNVTDLQLDWQIVGGLIVGGILAAPLAAYLCDKLPVKSLMTAVSVLIIGLSSYMLITSLLG